MFNSEDVRVLQEAYASVYESSHLETDTKKRHKDNDEAIEDMKKTKGYKDMAATAKKKMEEEVFDAILSHLISEGYADDATSAVAIMAHMSEEWRESIVEGTAVIRADVPQPGRRTVRMSATGKEPVGDRLVRQAGQAINNFLGGRGVVKSEPAPQRKPLVARPTK